MKLFLNEATVDLKRYEELDEKGMFKVRGRFIHACTTNRMFYDLEITDEAVKKAFNRIKDSQIIAKYMHSYKEIIGHVNNFAHEDGFIEGDYLINPESIFGAEAITHIKGDTLKSFSIGMLPIKTFTKQKQKTEKEILVVEDFDIVEISLVDIPADSEATMKEELSFFKERKEKHKTEEKEMNKTEEMGTDKSVSKEEIFSNIERFQEVGEVFNIDAKKCLGFAKEGLSIEAFKAQVLDMKTEEFKKREEALSEGEEALKVKQEELASKFKTLNKEFGSVLSKDEVPVSDPNNVDGMGDHYLGIDKEVENLFKGEKK